MKLISDGKPVKTKDGKYRLIEDWQFEHDVFRPILVVPRGYKTDLASIPCWAFWWRRGKWDIAAILHDFFCDHRFVMTIDPNQPGLITKKFIDSKDSDRLFYEICLAVGVHPLTALLMYWAVRIYSIYDATKRKIDFS